MYGSLRADYIEWPLPGPAHRLLLQYPPLYVQISCAAYTVQQKGKERRGLNNHAAYVLVLTQKACCQLAPYSSLSVVQAHGETPPPID